MKTQKETWYQAIDADTGKRCPKRRTMMEATMDLYHYDIKNGGIDFVDGEDE